MDLRAREEFESISRGTRFDFRVLDRLYEKGFGRRTSGTINRNAKLFQCRSYQKDFRQVDETEPTSTSRLDSIAVRLA